MRHNVIPALACALVLAAGASSGEELGAADGGPIPGSNIAGKKLIRVAGITSLFDKWPTFVAHADLPAKVAFWQQTGFDGIVFSVSSHRKAEAPESVHGQWWSITPRKYEDFAPEIEAFRSVEDWGRLTDNFLWSSTAVWGPGTPQDWFSDEHWKVIVANARLQGRIARECGFKGILLDTEQYDQHGRGPWRYPFNYKYYARAGYKLAAEEKPYSYAECVVKVRARAAQYARAITSTFPDLTLFVIDGLYDHTWRSAARSHPPGTPLAEVDDSLYPAFADGLLVALDERATIVAGTESTYGDSQYKDMLLARDAVKQQSIALSKYPELARRRITFSVGLWTDSGWGKDRFSDTDERVNQRDPERHMHAVHNALAASDKYAWTYGALSRFMRMEPTPLIRRYWKANMEAHTAQDLAWRPVPKWDLTDYTKTNEDMAVNDAAFWERVQADGWSVALDLPVHWRFHLDVEELLRHNNWTGEIFDHRAWPPISVLKCWQSQGRKANAIGIYRLRFEVPATLDPSKQEVVLAFGAFSPGSPEKGTGRPSWMDVHLNGKGYPMRNLIDVSESIRPGADNVVAVRVINRSGPAALMGHVKLLVRKR